jgi:hypothetical protein
MNKRPKPKRPKLWQRARVLVVLNSDGFVEIYAQRGLVVHIAQRLHVDGNETEATADEYLDATLPKAFKELFYPVKLQAVGQCRRLTVEDEVNRRTTLAVLRELRNLPAPATVPAAIAKARRAGK